MSSGDIRITFNDGIGSLNVVNHDLDGDDGLENAIIISLFTNTRAADEDVLPNNSNDRQGWWGDSLLGFLTGSKLWLLDRSKMLESNLRLAEDYCNSALKWLQEDGVVSKISVTVTRASMDTISIQINLTRPVGENEIVFRYFYNWENQLIRR